MRLTEEESLCATARTVGSSAVAQCARGGSSLRTDHVAKAVVVNSPGRSGECAPMTGVRVGSGVAIGLGWSVAAGVLLVLGRLPVLGVDGVALWGWPGEHRLSLGIGVAAGCLVLCAIASFAIPRSRSVALAVGLPFLVVVVYLVWLARWLGSGAFGG